ncbi:unnamed protein product, partial [Leptidea sinapis]|jgi:hypothetical protein
LIIL